MFLGVQGLVAFDLLYCAFLIDVLCAAFAVALFAGRHKVVEVVAAACVEWDDVVCVCGVGFAAPVAGWVAL